MEYQMKEILTGILLIMTIFLMLSLTPGCSENPESAQTVTATTTSSTSLSLLGINTDTVNAKALFSIGWRDLFDPRTSTESVMGVAQAIAFDSAQAKQKSAGPHSGIDIGSVSLSYGSTSLELIKTTGPQGDVMYSSSAGPRSQMTGSNVQFIASGTYEFAAGGSAKFSAIKASLTAPAGLLKITSPSDNQGIDTSADLAITWQGGDPNSAVLIQLMPQPPRPENDSAFQHGTPPDGGRMGPGGEPHGPGGPGGGMMGPPPGNCPPIPDSTNAVIVRLDANPGSYTITAAKLKELIHNSRAGGLMCSISQITVKDVDHDGGKVRLVLQNEDGVRLTVQ